MNSFNQALLKYADYEHTLTSLNDKIRKIREAKNNLEKKIIFYIKQQKLEKNKYKIGEEELGYATSKSKENITEEYLRTSLEKYFKDKKKAEDCLKFVWNGRATEEKEYLKLK